MKNTTQMRILSGFQDFLTNDMRSRNAVIALVRQAYEKFGFLPQETPCLEYAELLLGKYGDNQKLVYQFEDNGKRQVAMRYDLTVPLGRVVAMHGNKLTFPYRRYQIGMVWRADKPGKGRFREFMQMDADIVGDGSLLADTEIILLNIEIMKTLGIRAKVRVNTRQVLDSLIEKCDLDQSRGLDLVRCIDKYDKIGEVGVVKELSGLEFSESVIDIVRKYLSISGDNLAIIAGLKELLSTTKSFQVAYDYLNSFVALISHLNIDAERFAFDPSIARGLDYYTGLIFETVFLDDPSFGSICSGGRYDRLVKSASGEELPSIGISIGLDRLFAAMETYKLLPDLSAPIDVLIANFGNEFLPEYVTMATRLRALGLAVEIFNQPAKLAKQLKVANNKKLPYVILFGEDESAKGQVVVKHMLTGEQSVVELKDLEEKFKR